MKEGTKNMWDEFLGENDVSKDIGSIRKKGVLLEDILEHLKKKHKLEIVAVHYPEDAPFNYHERFYKGVSDIRVAWAEARVGTPSLVVSCSSKERWVEIRKDLRENNLVR